MTPENYYSGDTTALDATNEVVNKSSASEGTWKNVALGGSAGILLGSIATTLATSRTHGSSAAVSEETDDAATAESSAEEGTLNGADTATSNVPTATTQATFADETIAVAATVSDDMSFSSAFAAARHEVGTAGAFLWRGNVYSTFTREEWQAMSPQEKADYERHFSWGQHATAHHAEHATTTHYTAAVTPAEEPVTTPADDEVTVITTDEPEVQVLGVVHDTDSGMNFGGMMIDDQIVAFIDVDNDKTFDIVMSDLNHDGELQDNEVADISDRNITVDDLGGFINPDEEMYADQQTVADDLPLIEA